MPNMVLSMTAATSPSRQLTARPRATAPLPPQAPPIRRARAHLPAQRRQLMLNLLAMIQTLMRNLLAMIQALMRNPPAPTQALTHKLLAPTQTLMPNLPAPTQTPMPNLPAPRIRPLTQPKPMTAHPMLSQTRPAAVLTALQLLLTSLHRLPRLLRVVMLLRRQPLIPQTVAHLSLQRPPLLLNKRGISIANESLTSSSHPFIHFLDVCLSIGSSESPFGTCACILACMFHF